MLQPGLCARGSKVNPASSGDRSATVRVMTMGCVIVPVAWSSP